MRSSMKLDGRSLQARQVSSLLNLVVTVLDGLPSELKKAGIGRVRHDSRVVRMIRRSSRFRRLGGQYQISPI